MCPGACIELCVELVSLGFAGHRVTDVVGVPARERAVESCRRSLCPPRSRRDVVNKSIRGGHGILREREKVRFKRKGYSFSLVFDATKKAHPT